MTGERSPEGAKPGASPVQLLGFLALQQTGDSAGYIGSAMVTDQRGYPLEFRVLTPVKPTPMQKILFGAGLERYVGAELCGKQLVRGIQRKPRLFLVDRREQLSLGMEFSQVFLWLRRPGEQVAVRAAEEPRREEGRLEAAAGGFQAVVWEGVFDSENTKRDLLSLLSECSGNFDLMEAFKRMRAAVELLAKNDARYG
ncbi:MAG: hypothetical protein HY666_04550 [Chloroflexi bacterium]|nr:hypothetical protein [Chloroflexota bacterium]